MIARTSCVYCGVRISGVLPESRHTADVEWCKRARVAARVACAQHLDLAIGEMFTPVDESVDASQLAIVLPSRVVGRARENGEAA